MNNASILFISPSALHGGAEEALITYMEASAQLGYQPILVLPKTGWMTEQCQVNNIPFEIVSTLPPPYTYNKFVHFRSWFYNAIQIARLAYRWRAVLIHSNGARAAFHGGLGARFARIPSVAHIHDVIKLPYSSRILAGILKYLVDETICVSHFTKDEIIRATPFLNSTTRVIYNGTKSELYVSGNRNNIRQQWRIPSDELLIGTISTMVRFKGQDQLIKAFYKVFQVFPNIRLMIVGGAQGVPEQIIYESELKQMISMAAMNEKIFLTGWRENVVDYIHAFDIFAFTPTQPDSLPTVLIHASGVGKPIIASRVGGIPEIILDGKSGILIEPGHLDQLEGALIQLIKNPELRNHYSLFSREQNSRKFSFNAMKEQLGELYFSVIHQQ